MRKLRNQGDLGIRESWERGNSGSFGNQSWDQGDLGIRETSRNALGPAACPDPGSCWTFSRISAPSNGSWSDPVPAIPAAPDIPGILSAWECGTRIPKKAPGPGLPRGMSSIRLLIPWGWFLWNSGMCCLFQRVGKPRAFPKVLFFYREPVLSSFYSGCWEKLGFSMEALTRP